MSTGASPKATVLVIDDEQIIHESVRRVLEEEGYLVEGAYRVDHALSLLSAGSFDLVLADLMMPDRSGMYAVEAVAEDHPNTGVVVFTGFATVNSAVQSLKLGALDYLRKPFTPQELLDVTESALGRVRKTRRDREIEKTCADAESAIRSSLDLQEILKLICVNIVKLLKAKGASVLMFRKSDGVLEAVASVGLSAEYLEKGILESSRSVPKGMESEDPALVEEPDFNASLQYPEAARREGIAAMLSVPLRPGGARLAFLRIYSGERYSFGPEDAELVTKFAEQAARALENAISYEEVRMNIEALTNAMPAPNVTLSKKL